jgi:hypothetical protein
MEDAKLGVAKPTQAYTPGSILKKFASIKDFVKKMKKPR